MPSMYQPGIPTGFLALNEDYQNIQNNFQQLDTTFGVDHTTFSNQTAQNGFHTSIHIIPTSTTTTNPPNNQPPTQPATTAGFGQVWSAQINDLINTDEALFYLTGGGKNIQLTRNFLPTNSGNGATMLPGGLILNWGLYNAGGGNFSNGATNDSSSMQSVITLTQPFPNNMYIFGGSLTYVQTNRPSGPGTLSARQSQLSSGPITTINWQVNTNTNNYIGFVWYAFGN